VLREHFSIDDVEKMVPQIITGILHSFGQDYPGRKKLKKYVEKEARVFTLVDEERFLSKLVKFSDSGGFQAACGKISLSETRTLIDLHKEFLLNHYEVFDRAFLLDLPPGPDCKIFNNWKDVEKWNTETYTFAGELPDHIRKKMIYVHHFRTPKQWEIFNRIKNENGLFDKFQYHATGGIVANLQSDMQIPCIGYVLPLVPLLNDCMKYNRKQLNFHVLGGSGFRDILFYEMFRKHVDEKFEIDLNITYDSSGLYKSLMQGRTLHILDEESKSIKKTDIRSNVASKRFYNNSYSTEYRVIQKLNTMAEKFNFKKLEIDRLYDPKTNTLYDEFRAYAMLYMLDFYSEMQTVIRDYVEGGIYDIYKNGDVDEFNMRNIRFTKYLNNGKMTKKQTVKTNALSNSLDILTSLDEDYCKYLVDTFMIKDEVVQLNHNTGLLTC